MNTTIRNVLIVLAIAAVVAFVQGGATAANVAIQAVTLVFLGTIVWFLALTYRERRLSLYSLGDRRLGGAPRAQALEQHVRALDLKAALAQGDVDILELDVVQLVAALAAEMVMGRDVGVEAAGARAFHEPEQAGLGQLAQRVVDGGAGEHGELEARLLEDPLGAEVG